jgi:hypothetical protein
MISNRPPESIQAEVRVPTDQYATADCQKRLSKDRRRRRSSKSARSEAADGEGPELAMILPSV